MVLSDYGLPPKQGLYSPEHEKDACGVGFIAKINGETSHKIVKDALILLKRMNHRGACGCEKNTGDGAGIMSGHPHQMYLNIIEENNLGFTLPPPGQYASGVMFLDQDINKAVEGQEGFEKVANEHGFEVLGWYDIPFNDTTLGKTAKGCQPIIKQVFVTSSYDQQLFHHKLFQMRKVATHTVRTKNRRFYICSLSTDVIVYKGMFTTDQLSEFYTDLDREDYVTHFAIVHGRFSTNTFPSWERAHPNRYLSHNGEINTICGNTNNMNAREGNMFSEYYAEQTESLFPVVEDEQTDSGRVDNILELLIMAGNRTLPEAVMMLVPEAWQNDDLMSTEKKNFYKWASCSVEPWDGPAQFTFSDGRYVGAILDRNGLRPSRYYITHDGHMVMASEVGVHTFADEEIKIKGRLQPGKMLLVDTKLGILVEDEELKHNIACKYPVEEWLGKGIVTLSDLHKAYKKAKCLDVNVELPVIRSHEKITCLEQDRRLPLFGYSVEDLTMLIVPMIINKKEAIGSMGNDAPLACLSTHPQMVFDYFKQLFAQVTNPPIDPIREAIVMSLACPVGPEHNFLDASAKTCQRLYLDHPVLSCADLEIIRECPLPQWKSATLDIVYPVDDGTDGLELALDRLCKEASEAVDKGCAFIILSDRKAGPKSVPISCLIALGCIHHYLNRTKQRRKIGLFIESAEIRETHHICLLIGYGGDAVCPYLLLETVANMRDQNLLKPPLTDQEIVEHYIIATQKGISKVMAKMGISTLHSYKGAQRFEAVGIAQEVIDKCFIGTDSRLGGVSFDILAQEALDKHSVAYADRECDNWLLTNRGEYHWRDGGEKHVNDPRSISHLQDAVKQANQEAYDKYAVSTLEMVKACTLRGQLKFKFSDKPIDLSEVEPAAEIVKRFVTGAMSFGSISIETHTTLAKAMNSIGGKSNTGEGGEDPNRGGEGMNNTRSAIRQIASGRFGVTSTYLANAEELQIKMAQGAKPGEGGELPGHKVSHEIAKTRKSVPGVGLISPPPHHDIYSIEDLAELIYNLKASNPSSRISVKLVSEVGVGVVASGVAKGHAEHIVISGHDGGTGASTWSGIKHAGLPWELGLSEAHQTLVLNDLRRRVVLQVDGQMRTGRDVIVAALLGADEFGFSTAPLIALGCTMMRKCHLNTCPVGIATQDPVLRKKFEGKPENVVNFFFMLAEEVRTYLARFGYRRMSDIIGQCDLLLSDDAQNRKTQLLDFSSLLTHSNELRAGDHSAGTEPQDHKLEERKDNDLIAAAQDVLNGKITRVVLDVTIVNSDRALGTTLSYHVARLYGEQGLPDDAIHVNVHGSAGQSFGAFLSKGITLELEGDANDYVGKGLSGGHVIVYPSRKHGPHFKAEDNVIVGNTCLYGATSGKAFIRGITAERFCVRNSGAVAVCEGVGDHCCEYMTGGMVVVLGSTGRNFAAGMYGGIAFVLDRENTLTLKCNHDTVDLESVVGNDVDMLKGLLEEHLEKTGSRVAKILLDDWTSAVHYFTKIIPKGYKDVLANLQKECDENIEKETRSSSENKEKKEDSPPPVKKINNAPIVDIESAIPDMTMEQKIIDRVLDKTRGFVKYARSGNPYRPAKQRINDWKEIYSHKKQDLKVQAARCMDCGVPFCQSNTGCPLGNVIPKWNDLVFQDEWQQALDRLLQTNNFPEFTGRVCPAPCEGACVLSINAKPVTIKKIECTIIDHAFEKGWIKPQIPLKRTGKCIAIVGSGPAGMAAASQLNKAGHLVTVYERNDRCGGLLTYGIPSMKLDKYIVQRRLDLMKDEGIIFKTNAEVGKTVGAKELLSENDAVLLAVGSTWPRDLPIPGRHLKGVHFAMNFLETSQKRQMGNYNLPSLDATGKDVVVIGGGDTGVDCIGTSVRQDARSITTFELLAEPPHTRSANNPWPTWPRIFRVEYGHEEVAIKYGRDPRVYNIMSKEFIGNEDGHVTGIKAVEIQWVKDLSGRWAIREVPNTEQVIQADLVLIALGFIGPEKSLAKQFGAKLDLRGNFATKRGEYQTNIDKLYTAGDCHFGQSLIVTAIAEGRQAAREIDLSLMGTSSLAGPGGQIHTTRPPPKWPR
ncbi:putative glutamate synthase [NADPH] [Exaiptasia diaphana]|uniref:Glutamate synthase [NADH] n=1 Tax=Exaiptasia diaphana TaxID=2652724 RepID=A0A913YUU5_EXADI|nr:putative glutamate synthase [NADPH] [Exaiptasia diaphana]KXJ22785.1 putative glutamate synthase [NADPH] [Exaiptasia diaphana]